MKGLRIAVNVLLAVAIVAEIALILFLVIGGREIVGQVIQGAADSTEDPGGKAAGAFAGALVGVLLYVLFLGGAVIVFAGLVFAVISIIVFNKKGYAPLGFCIICLLFIPAGVLMLIQRSKFLQEQVNKRSLNDFV